LKRKTDLAARLELNNAIKFKSDKIEALAGTRWESTSARRHISSCSENLRRIVELDPNDTEARVKLGKMLLAEVLPRRHSESLRAEEKQEVEMPVSSPLRQRSC